MDLYHQINKMVHGGFLNWNKFNSTLGKKKSSQKNSLTSLNEN